jgi:hypothetical protein
MNYSLKSKLNCLHDSVRDTISLKLLFKQNHETFQIYGAMAKQEYLAALIFNLANVTVACWIWFFFDGSNLAFIVCSVGHS